MVAFVAVPMHIIEKTSLLLIFQGNSFGLDEIILFKI